MSSTDFLLFGICCGREIDISECIRPIVEEEDGDENDDDAREEAEDAASIEEEEESLEPPCVNVNRPLRPLILWNDVDGKDPTLNSSSVDDKLTFAVQRKDDASLVRPLILVIRPILNVVNRPEFLFENPDGLLRRPLVLQGLNERKIERRKVNESINIGVGVCAPLPIINNGLPIGQLFSAYSGFALVSFSSFIDNQIRDISIPYLSV
mmetsp:Transcript_28764/g.46180  ORF Transcript_28764/g.46180 Transcript_28764/m.46180 type:complete len:209 (-) Transcript_28764:70-696(-)